MTPPSPRLLRLRWLGFGLLVTSFVLAFFHRNTPAAMADALSEQWRVGPAQLAAISASYFWVYTLMQVPSGILADLYGPRRIVSIGMVIAGLGTLAFALAPGPAWGAVGRVLIGFGVAFPFIGLLKFSAVWFPERQFATLSGLTVFIGNVGAALAATPLVLLMHAVAWTTLFEVLGVATLLLAVAVWRGVHDRPEHVGLPPVHAPTPQETGAGMHWRRGLSQVLGNRATWPGFFVNLGMAGGIFGFAGLWGIPYLQEVYGWARADVAEQMSVMMLACACGGLFIGRLSDRMGRRRPVMLAFAIVHTLLWLPWALRWPLGEAASMLLSGLLGFSAASFALTWAAAKEVNAPRLAGMASGVVNTGAFLGAALVQQAIGSWVEHAVGSGTAHPVALAQAVWLIPAVCVVSVVAAALVTETGARNISHALASARTRQ